jgi:aminopeptidase N
MYKFFITMLLLCYAGQNPQTQNLTDRHLPYAGCSKARNYSRLMAGPGVNKGLPWLQDYDVNFCFLDLQVERTSAFISGNVSTTATVTATVLDTFALELINGMTVDSVSINGSPNSFSHQDDVIFIPLTTPAGQGNQVNATVYYHGTPPAGTFFSGVTHAVSPEWGNEVTWSLSEPFAAKDWWPCKQDLTDKLDSVWVFLTTDASNKAGSQGLLTAVTPLPDNRLRYEWKSRYPIDYYLVSFAVSDYIEYTIYAKPDALQGDSIPIQNYLYDDPAFLEQNKFDIDQTATFLELFSGLFGLYPFHEEKYGHCYTELGGGMEHQTMTTIGAFGFGIVAHELSHMWFGDLVTCATWSDIWINEGFATYSDYLAHEYVAGSYWSTLWMAMTEEYVISEPGGSVYIPPDHVTPDSVERIFDARLSYYKGACLLHMLRFEMQDDTVFFHTLRKYLEDFGGGTATGMDFKAVAEEVSGKDFTGFFNQWYFGEGYPVFSVHALNSCCGLALTVTETTSSPVTPLFKMLVPYKLMYASGYDTTVVACQTDSVNTFTFPVTGIVVDVVVDPDNHVLHKTGSVVIEGVEEHAAGGFSMFPNPAHDRLALAFSGEAREGRVTVFNLDGRQVLEQTFSGATVLLEVDRLPPGLYLIRIEADNGVMAGRFIRQ